MTDKNDPGASPGLLAGPPKRGVGVRRLNKKPLMILCGLIGLAIVAVSYTFNERQKRNQTRPAAIEEIAIEETSVAPVRSTGFDFIPAETPNETMATPQPGPLGSPEVPALDQQQLPMQPGQQQMTQQADEAMQQRLRMIQRVEENKLASLEAALSADAGVQNFEQGTAQGAPGGQSNVVPPLPAGGRPGAAGGAQGGVSPAQLAAMAAGMGGAAGGQRQADPNQQAAKRDFLSQEPSPDTYLAHTRMPAISPFEVKAGTVIPGVMIGGINSDLPGQIIGQVRETVYDTATGGHVLIPAGARLIGTYDSAVTMGQRRVLVAWNRIIYPDGSSMSLGAMPGADQSGYGGFSDKVNNHYARIFGNALMLSLFSAGIQLSQGDAPAGANGQLTNQQIMSAELGRQMGQLGMEMTRRNMDIQPTLEVRPGYLFNIMVTKDMVLPPWGSGRGNQ